MLLLYHALVCSCCCTNVKQEETLPLTLGNTAIVQWVYSDLCHSWRWCRAKQTRTAGNCFALHRKRALDLAEVQSPSPTFHSPPTFPRSDFHLPPPTLKHQPSTSSLPSPSSLCLVLTKISQYNSIQRGQYNSLCQPPLLTRCGRCVLWHACDTSGLV